MKYHRSVNPIEPGLLYWLPHPTRSPLSQPHWSLIFCLISCLHCNCLPKSIGITGGKVLIKVIKSYRSTSRAWPKILKIEYMGDFFILCFPADGLENIGAISPIVQRCQTYRDLHLEVNVHMLPSPCLYGGAGTHEGFEINHIFRFHWIVDAGQEEVATPQLLKGVRYCQRDEVLEI